MPFQPVRIDSSPGTVPPDGGQPVAPSAKTQQGTTAVSDATTMESDATEPGTADPFEWELDARLRHLGRLLGREGERPARSAAAPSPEARGSSAPATPRSASRRPRSASDRGSGLLAWSILGISIMAVTCGGVLLAMAYGSGRADLWPVALPTVGGGILGLFLGVLIQMDRLAQQNRQLQGQMEDLRVELNEVRAATRRMSLGGASRLFD